MANRHTRRNRRERRRKANLRAVASPHPADFHRLKPDTARASTLTGLEKRRLRQMYIRREGIIKKAKVFGFKLNTVAQFQVAVRTLRFNGFSFHQIEHYFFD